MEKLIKVWMIAIALLTVMSCKTIKQPITEVPIHYKERIVERLVPMKVNNDSLKLRAMFECDSLNKVVLKQLKEDKTKGVESQFTFDNGQFDYNATAIHDTIYIAAKDSFIYKEVPVNVAVYVEVNKLTKLQVIQIRAGKAMFWLLGAGGIYLLVLKRSIVFPFVMKLLKWLKSLF
ncbi:MAG: hypothetical protein A2066_18845 [Bacteroidetes bacterium GWB2_41_8]|nr:MAG: hypothetical protein A2066_18845 [Bacteroidetes bacterium GWB2_41_8]